MEEIDFFEHYARLDDLAGEVAQRTNPCLGAKVVHSLEVIDRAFDTYSEEGLAVSFNGGKDCTLLLHLVLYAYLRRRRTRVNAASAKDSEEERRTDGEGTASTDEARWMRILYFWFPTCFPEETQFVMDTTRRLRLDLVKSTKSYREGLQEIIETARPPIQGIFMGTRHTDPSCARLEEFSSSTPGWPSFMRVNPILDWSYSDVWAFILAMDIPYCSLYDKGYTSIGEVNNTKPNPALFVNGTYAPAYTLKDEEQERAGRLLRPAT
jgi:FAD synthetase